VAADLRLSITGDGDQRRALVVIFLRGAADGLTLVPPAADDDYQRARPTLALRPESCLPLDDLFGLNPQLADLLPLYRDGRLAVIHAAGSEDDSRSHFAAQDLMEHGGLVAGGWLGRFLRQRPTRPGALLAVAVGEALSESLRGAPSVAVMRSLEDFTLGPDADRLVPRLARLWAGEGGELGRAARDTLAALRRLEALRAAPYRPAGGAVYPPGDFGRGLELVARLIKARVGLEAATLDLGGWDSHFAQSTLIRPLMARLGTGLAAFARDLGPELATTTVVVMTEFGRRLRENASLGTDHGRGSVMLVAGGGVAGGRVIADWPGLADAVLEGPGDVPVKHNYRDVLAPVLHRHGVADLSEVFPGYRLAPLDLYG